MMGKMVWSRRAAVLAGLAMTGLGWPAFNDEVVMVVEPVWGRGVPAGAVVPIRVIVENSGPDRTGTIEAQGLGVSRVSIDLPRDSEKEVILYPAANSYGYENVEVTLRTQGGSIQFPVELQSPYSGPAGMCVVGLITDNQGAFSFIRNAKHKDFTFSDAYLKPQAALERAVGYAPADLLILGDGAERLSDRAVAAIKRYVMLGGTLVFMGGASAPILRDERWQDVLPVRNPRATTVRSIPFLNQFGNPPTGPIPVMDVDPVPNAITLEVSGVTVMTEKVVGLGSIFVLGFNLTDAPLNKWTGRLGLFANLNRQTINSIGGFRDTSAGYTEFVGLDDLYGGYPAAAPSPGGENDPFQAKLPPTSTILMILIGFWVVVIPVHFGILKKMKRGELAWFTAPLIALGFAGLLFTLASGLYQAGLSTSLRGILFRADGSREGIFVGRQQLFFPSGGKYDLGLKSVEALLPMPGNPWDYLAHRRGTDTSFQQDLFDVGEVIAPQASATNLNFKEFRFAEARSEDWSLPASISLKRSGKDVVISGTITNQSAFTISNPSIFAAGRPHPIKLPIAPGEKKTFSVRYSTSATPPAEMGVALWGFVEGFEAGARIGKSADNRQQEIFYSYGTFKVGG